MIDMLNTRAGRKSIADIQDKNTFVIKLIFGDLDDLTQLDISSILSKISSAVSNDSNFFFLLIGNKLLTTDDTPGLLDDIEEVFPKASISIDTSGVISSSFVSSLADTLKNKIKLFFTYASSSELTYSSFLDCIASNTIGLANKPQVFSSSEQPPSEPPSDVVIRDTGLVGMFFVDGSYYSREQLQNNPSLLVYTGCVCSPLLSINLSTGTVSVRPACAQKKSMQLNDFLTSTDLSSFLAPIICPEPICNQNSMFNTKYSLIEYKRMIDTQTI